MNFRIHRDHFGGFLEGNGEFNYAMNIKPFSRYILSTRNQARRIEAGKQVMTGLYAYRPQLKMAFEIVNTYLTDRAFVEHQSMLMTDLKKYYEAVCANFDCFMQFFRDCE